MCWEVIQTIQFPGDIVVSVFKGKDSEGSTCYTWTWNAYGWTVQPTGMSVWYDLESMLSDIAENG